MLGHRRYTLSESRRWRILRLPSSMYRSNCFLSFLSLHLPCPALFFKQHPVLIEKSPTSAEKVLRVQTGRRKVAFSLVLVRVHGAVDRTCSGVQGAVLVVGMRSKLPGKKIFHPCMVSSHSESTKVKLTHPTEIQKSMEVKRRKEAKKQNDFCGGKRHIATFQNYRNQLVLSRPRKAWYRPKASFTSCSARWQRTWHVQRYWKAKGAKRT